MNNDLISREAAVDAVERTAWYHQNKDGDMVSGANSAEHQAWYKADDVYKALSAVPSAEPERKKGKWTIEDCHAATYKYCCSICKAHHRVRYDFCPSCGADMRLNREE